MTFTPPKSRIAIFEEFMDEATTHGPNQKITGCAVVVTDKDGKLASSLENVPQRGYMKLII